MKKLISTLLILMLANVLTPESLWAALSDLDKSTISGGTLVNPSADGGTAGYSKSGGTFTTGGTVAGQRYFSWDSSAAGQTVLSGYQTVNSGDAYSGSNGAISARFKCDSGTCTHKLQVYDGTNVLVERTITSSTTQFQRTSVNFQYPASGVVAWRLISVAADEPKIYWRDGYRGLADGFNLSQVSQAQLLGTIKITGCASTWSTTSTSFAAFSAQTGCTYATTGAALAPSTNIPAIKFASIGPGEIKLEAEGNIGQSVASKSAYFQFTDGTITAREISNFYSAGGLFNAPGISQSLTYTTPQSNVTLQINGMTDSGGTAYLWGSNSIPLVIRVYYFPSQSQTGYKPDQTPGTWSASSNISGSTASTTTTDFGSVSGSVTPTANANITCAAASGVVGITCNLPKAGAYKICYGGWTSNSGANSNYVGLTDGSGNALTGLQVVTSAGAGYGGSIGQCGGYNATSSGSFTFKLQGKVISGTQTVNATSWSVDESTASTGAIYLQNQISSNTSGQERIEHADINLNGSTCSVNSQSGTWLTAAARPSSRRCTLTVASGIFSSANYHCTCSASTGAIGSCGLAQDTVTKTATTFQILTDTTLLDNPFSIICMGPR